MHISAITAAFNAAPFNTQASAQQFLDQYSPETQLQVISAMYLGREHLHQNTFREDLVQHSSAEGLSQYCDHIQASDFARILEEKNTSAKTYLQRFLTCYQKSL